ncbi:hypothetical protein AM500_21400 [Bacillus sp. FJAT-18017]|uniref:head-tail connector protein n=1 Tax=Bacillus sp. FJAT-18017 TaxID=1705566 RepID=UPI0006AE19CD|nr:head-tail connector protein [Bacillus sp. FJAT-18017]ALC92065.1 hypothetical protein AM500_21400 [Bacillus sp. FJAT-18017]
MGELITLEDAKSYLRDTPPEDDKFIKDLLIKAARSFCETKLKRPLLAEKMTDETRWDIPEEVIVAMYMLIAHWYENRGVLGRVEGEIAFSVNALIGPYKFHSFGGS